MLNICTNKIFQSLSPELPDLLRFKCYSLVPLNMLCHLKDGFIDFYLSAVILLRNEYDRSFAHTP